MCVACTGCRCPALLVRPCPDCNWAACRPTCLVAALRLTGDRCRPANHLPGCCLTPCSGDWQLPLMAVGRALQGMAVFYAGCQAEVREAKGQHSLGRDFTGMRFTAAARQGCGRRMGVVGRLGATRAWPSADVLQCRASNAPCCAPSSLVSVLTPNQCASLCTHAGCCAGSLGNAVAAGGSAGNHSGRASQVHWRPGRGGWESRDGKGSSSQSEGLARHCLAQSGCMCRLRGAASLPARECGPERGRSAECHVPPSIPCAAVDQPVAAAAVWRTGAGLCPRAGQVSPCAVAYRLMVVWGGAVPRVTGQVACLRFAICRRGAQCAALCT